MSEKTLTFNNIILNKKKLIVSRPRSNSCIL